MNTTFKRVLYFAGLVILSVTMVLGGCTKEQEKETETETPVTEQETETEKMPVVTEDTKVVTEETPTTRKVTDSAGTEITIPYTVERVAPQIGAMAHMTAVLGCADRLVCTAFGGTNAYFNKVFPTYAKANPRGLTTGNVEDIIGSGAQVAYGPIRDQATIDQLNAAGIAVVKLDSFSTVEQMKGNIREIAKILGGDAPAIAENFCEYYQGNFDYVSEKTAGIAQGDKVRALMLNYRAGALSTINAEDICSVYMTEAGGINVAAESGATGATPGTSISSEDVIRWNPDVIFTHNKSGKDQILTEPTFQTIPAVKNGKVYIVPTGTYLWSVRSAEGSLMPLWLAKMMYPDLFTELDLRQEVREFYRTFHGGYKIPEDELDMILAGSQS